ncbi:MAG: uroporphyrinogen-III synthase [Sphingomonadales bacterium]|nr:uroporphyrinogen-III synthase [Sphingomonadales bacterium]
MKHALPLIVTRADPGGAATAARARAMGFDARHLPLFAARPLEWSAPDPAEFDALLLTSAQAVRLAGPGLARLADLPAYAVGAATAAAAEAAGLRVAMTGKADAQAVIEAMTSRNVVRILWLCGRDRSALDAREAVLTALPVYAVEAVEPSAEWAAAIAEPAIVLAHSARGAARIAALTGAVRAHLAIAALSASVAGAAGDGWAAIAIAAQPDDASLLAAAHDLCQKGLK